MRLIFAIVFLFCIKFAFTQDVPKDYYEPFKMIRYKSTSSFGYFMYNLSPTMISHLKFTTNEYPYLNRKYKADALDGFTNSHMELYQYWNVKNKNGLEFAFIRTAGELTYTYVTQELGTDGINPFPTWSYSTIARTSNTLQWGFVPKEPLAMGFTISNIYFEPLQSSMNDQMFATFKYVPGFYLKIGTAFISGKDKRRFGFYEVFGFKYKSEGVRYKYTLEKPSYLGLYGYLRFFSTSKPIRRLGLIFTFADIAPNFESIKFENQGISINYFDLYFKFGMGLAW